MLVQEHPVAVEAVRGVGGIFEYLMFPLPTLIDAYNRTGEEPATPGQPARPTFASSFGGALGETTGKFLVVAAVVGIGLWYLNKRK